MMRKVLKMLIVGLLLTASVGRGTLAQEGGWSTPVMISTNTLSSWFPDIAVDARGQPHVVWNSGRPGNMDQGQMDLLMYSTLVDQKWLEPNDIEVTAYGGYTIRPAIAVGDDGILHVTFRGEVTIYYTQAAVSEAWNASSWTPRRRISGSGSAYYSDVAVDEQGGIHVVWNEGISAGADERWLWFGTRKGSALYDGKGWLSQGPQAGLEDREIYASIEDSSGVQWFGTDAGAYRFDGVTWQVFDSQDGLADQKVNCVAQDSDGRLWFGTDGGVSIYDEEVEQGVDKWTTYTSSSELPDDVVHSIAVDPLGVVWLGTEKGLASYDGQDWVTYTSEDGLAADAILAIAVDSQRDVWVGSKQGISRYDRERWTTYTADSGLLGNEVTDLVVDRHGVVWAGTDLGLSRFDGQAWSSGVGEGLVVGAVTALMVDTQGIVWVASEAGVSTYDGQDWETFPLPQKFAGQRVTAIAGDSRVNAMCLLCADVFYRHSMDGGESWSTPVNLSNSLAGSTKPQVHIGSGGNVYVTWEEGEDWYTHDGYPVASMYVHSPDGGDTWAEPTAFSSPLGTPQQITLGAGRDDDLVVVWRLDAEESDYYYQNSTDDGITWSEPQPIPGVIAKPWKPFSLDGYHTATDSAGNVHLLALGYLSSSVEEELGLIHTIWNGSEWSSPSVIYASNNPPEWPRIDVGVGNKVYATWFTRDERHIIDTDGARYKVWVSSYQADAPSQTPVPPATQIPTLTPQASDRMAFSSTMVPAPVVPRDGSGLPPGLYTESDEVGRLMLALSPITVIVLIITALRLGWFRRRR
jgi:hypothetical protein